MSEFNESIVANASQSSSMISNKHESIPSQGIRRIQPRYVVVSPVRDEADTIDKTIESMRRQSSTPVEWVIVNDGSSDSTPQILDSYSKQIPWLQTVHRVNRGFRQPGGGVIAAFDEGYERLKTKDWDFVVKLDGDLSFERDYFEKCLQRFEENPKLGIGGGTIQSVHPEKMVIEKVPAFHVRGATKIYRRRCWEQLGGLLKAPGWDTLDEVKANMLGWETQSFSDILITQHRATGGPEGTWKDSFKNGLANYICGYHPVFMALKCAKRVFRRPYLVSSVALMSGFLSGYLERKPRVDDAELIGYLRKQQMKRLFFSESIWK